jgi:hypothetical protein
VVDFVAVGLPDEGKDVDEVCGIKTSAWVVAEGSNASCARAGNQLEAAGAVGFRWCNSTA